MVRYLLVLVAFPILTATSACGQECSVSDISVESVSTSNGLVATKVRGRLVNRCSSPTGPQVKFVFWSKSGTLLRVFDAWPASVNNIQPGSDYPFEFSLEKVDNFDRLEVRVIQTRLW
ncbi:hypothetical protein SAMN05216350_107191 [Polaromonas sp. YR568]|nr:hypothetical protein SAMN05216350_107191 [Polaromonas sp. YR568]